MTALFQWILTGFLSQALDLPSIQGGARTDFRSPNGLQEICVVPIRWPGGHYKKGDAEKETELCSYDFYSTVGLCPKYTSSNPAILLIKPNEKYSKEKIDASSCNVKDMDVKTEAKFKQSISCSNTSSILAYYQLSRFFGDAGRVPVAVLRSMDRKVHLQLTQKANQRLRGSSSVIAQTWSQFLKVHRRPGNYPEVVDQTQTQIYGALSDNIKREEIYTEVSGKGRYESRYQRFLKQNPFLRVASSRSVPEMVGSSEFTRVAQTVTQMKDVGDMIVLDTLLNQQDRIGNIHYRFYWYWLNPENPGRIERTKSEASWNDRRLKVPPEETRAMKGRPATLVKEMILKDNDCGVSKTNMMRQIRALEKVRHLSYFTYSQVLALEKALSSSYAKEYFTKEMLFSSDEFNSLRSNATKAKEVLRARCQSRQLRFDVDLADYLPGAPTPRRSCDMSIL